MAISLAARDRADLTLVGTGQGVVGTVGGVVSWSNLIDRFMIAILALPWTFWTGGGVVVQVPQFPRPLTPTLLVGAVNLKLVDTIAFEELVLMSSKVVFFAHWARFSFSTKPVGSLLGDMMAAAGRLVWLNK